MDPIDSPAFVVRNSRRQYILLLLACVAFCGIGARLIASGDRSCATWVPLALFGGPGIPTAVRQLVDRRPRLVLDREGVMDRTLKVGVIPWAEIEDAQLVSMFGQEFIALSLRDPTMFTERWSPFWKKLAAVNRRLAGSELNVNLSGLPIRGPEVLKFIHAACERARRA